MTTITDAEREELTKAINRATFVHGDFISPSVTKAITDALLSLGYRRSGAWEPISTAPKDGTELLLAHKFAFVGRWFQPGFGTEGWWTANAMPVEPTHWQHLPQPPEA